MGKKYRKPHFLSTELLKGLPTSHPMPRAAKALSISPSVKSSALVTQYTSPSLIHLNNVSNHGKVMKIGLVFCN